MSVSSKCVFATTLTYFRSLLTYCTSGSMCAAQTFPCGPTSIECCVNAIGQKLYMSRSDSDCCRSTSVLLHVHTNTGPPFNLTGAMVIDITQWCDTVVSPHRVTSSESLRQSDSLATQVTQIIVILKILTSFCHNATQRNCAGKRVHLLKL